MISRSAKRSNDTIVETFKDTVPLSFGEEIGNTVSYGVAALLTLLVLPYVAVHNYTAHGTFMPVSMSIYVISIFMMFILSTIHHSIRNETPHEYILRTIDHSMIYVAISGTYTPILLTVVDGWIDWTVFTLLWGTTLQGILYKSIAVKVNQKSSLVVYLAMGQIGIILLPIISTRTSWIFILFVFLGGMSCTIGTWFYVQKNRPYFCMIWHTPIVIALPLHLIAILYFIQSSRKTGGSSAFFVT